MIRSGLNCAVPRYTGQPAWTASAAQAAKGPACTFTDCEPHGILNFTGFPFMHLRIRQSTLQGRLALFTQAMHFELTRQPAAFT